MPNASLFVLILGSRKSYPCVHEFGKHHVPMYMIAGLFTLKTGKYQCPETYFFVDSSF